MKGIGKTVAKGTTIEEFHVEVLGGSRRTECQPAGSGAGER